jgi:peroxiredoxin
MTIITGAELDKRKNSKKVHKQRGRSDRSLAKSRIARDGLSQGATAPNFILPRLNGEQLSLEEYRGRKVLLVFSDPECGPCDLLAPYLEKLSRRTPDIQVIMVSRGDAEANRLKIDEHEITFPVVLQRQWETSRLYAKFATPIAYMVDEGGMIAAEMAAGPVAILNLLISAAILSLLDARREVIAEPEFGPQPKSTGS